MMGKWLWIGAFALLCLLLSVVLFAGWILARNGRVGVSGDFTASTALLAPPKPLTVPATLKLATFNIQALWVVGKDRPQRMRAIADVMRDLDPDVVGFQEVFVQADRALLISELVRQTRLLYHQYYPSASLGSGLLISSAHPIGEVFFHRYTLCGPTWKVWEGDGLVGKGIALARIFLPGGGFFDFFDTHTQAGYGNPYYKEARRVQLAEAADFIQRAHAPAVPAFFVGDMNCHPGSPDFQAAVDGAGLTRVMNLETGIDHIFAVNSPAYRFEVLDTRPIRRTTTENGRTFELSDHSGYCSVVAITPTGAAS